MHVMRMMFTVSVAVITGVIAIIFISCTRCKINEKNVNLTDDYALPRLVNMNNSHYGDWRTVFTEIEDSGVDVFLIRLKEIHTQANGSKGDNYGYKPQQLITLLQMCVTKRNSYVFF